MILSSTSMILRLIPRQRLFTLAACLLAVIVSLMFRKGNAEVTVVILNWSRFPNLPVIAKSLCALSDVVDSIFIWNNNPNVSLSYEAFVAADCSPSQLRIHNSDSNEYFKARFIACSQSTTRYCFFQDDDYLISTPTLRSMYLWVSSLKDRDLPGIHLSPPLDTLLTRLREISVAEKEIHTSFAWLGYGSLIRRDIVVDFLELMDELNMSTDEQLMADNYFTILENRVPEVWIVTEPALTELGGGQPFTVGEEGEHRNKRHILRAAQLLDHVTTSTTQIKNYPLTNFNPPSESSPILRAPCAATICVLETTIQIFPVEMGSIVSRAADLFDVQERNLMLISPEWREVFYNHPISHAVDGNMDTLFRSPSYVRNDETLTLDFLSIFNLESYSAVTLIICKGLERDLPDSLQLLYSPDGQNWHAGGFENFACASDPVETKCSASAKSDLNLRYIRIQAIRDLDERWCIYEVEVHR